VSTIANNAFQRRMQDQVKNIKQASYGNLGNIKGFIQEVYDTDSALKIPESIAIKLAKSPGKLFAKVLTDKNTVYYLSFSDSAEVIYSTFGDEKSLRGRRVLITFFDGKVKDGEIKIINEEKKKLMNTTDSIIVLNISGIL
jgi:hypothetical protein